MNRAIIGAPILLLVGLVAFIIGPPGRYACGQVVGFTPAMIELIGSCPEAAQRLGTGLSFSPFRGGFGGNYESGGDVGEGVAYGELGVSGSSGSANVEYQLSKGAGLWSPSVMVLTFDDGKKLDVKACTKELVEAKQAEAGQKLFVEQCEQGRADICLALSHIAQAKGDAAAATSWAKKACELGAREACR